MGFGNMFPLQCLSRSCEYADQVDKFPGVIQTWHLLFDHTEGIIGRTWTDETGWRHVVESV